MSCKFSGGVTHFCFTCPDLLVDHMYQADEGLQLGAALGPYS